jgi:hypothetical protein
MSEDGRNKILQNIQKVGLISENPKQLEYWGLPIGVI